MITIKQIQEWEKSFVKRKGIDKDEEKGLKIGTLKLMEEVGEVMKAILEKKWEEVPAELADVIIFACKIANIAEQFHKTDELSSVLERKINYVETRTYDKKINKFDKPKNKEFK